MGDLIKISKALCRKCKYHGGTDQKLTCNYLACTGHSRIFDGREMKYDPKYCDKFEKGKMLQPFKNMELRCQQYDEFRDYKMTKIRKEQTSYEYKHKFGETKRRYRGNL